MDRHGRRLGFLSSTADRTDGPGRRFLQNARATSIVAARDGSVWIGTNDGLHRWRDGRVTIYRTQTHPELPDDAIQSLAEDERGRIWVTGVRGLAMFDNGRFTSVPTPIWAPSLRSPATAAAESG